MQTQDMQAEQTQEQTPAAADPAEVALDAIQRYDRSRMDKRTSPEVVAELYDVATVCVQYAILAEMRKQTRYLNSLESWLINIDDKLAPAEENEP